jgi:hypothetical protein
MTPIRSVEKRVLITGCGRSGTKYVAALLRHLGLDVGHETMGKDGVANWCMAVDCEDSPWGGGRRGITFKTTLHQIRHPLKVIPSLITADERSWRFIERYVPCYMHEPILLRATKYWYYWNLEAERTAEWHYRVEGLKSVFNEFCSRVGVNVNHKALQKVSSLSNSRKVRPWLKWMTGVLERSHLDSTNPIFNFMYDRKLNYSTDAFTWEVLEEHAPGWAKRVQELAHRYGYTVDDDRAAAI